MNNIDESMRPIRDALIVNGPTDTGINYMAYIIDLALMVAFLGVGFVLHVLDHGRKYVTRAEFDKHVAAVRMGAEPVRGQRDGDGVAGRDAVPLAADGDHADAALGGRPDLHDGDRAPADVRDADALHGDRDSNSVVAASRRREDADAGLRPSGSAEVAAERVDEVRERNGGAGDGKQ